MKKLTKTNPYILKIAKNIMKIWLAGIFLVLSSTTMANYYSNQECAGIDRTTQYYMDGNGFIKQYPISVPVKRYKPWTYLDENGYDYTILIEVK